MFFFAHSALLHIGLMGITDVLLNFYFVSIGYSPGVIGILQALPRLGGFVTGLPVGMVANRVGSRRMLIIASVGIAASIVMMVALPTLAMLAISRFLLGFFYGAGQIVTAPLMMTLTKREEHTHQFSYHNLVSMGSVALGSVIGGALPLLYSGLLSIEGTLQTPPEQMPTAYVAALLTGAVAVLLGALPLLGLQDREPAVDETDEPDERPLRDVPWGRIVRLSLPLFVFGVSGGLTFPFYNLFFRESFGISDALIGTILSFGWLGMALVPLLNPLWERHFGRANALALLMALAAVGFFGLGAVKTLALAIPFYLVGISLRNTMQPLFQPLIMDTLPPHLHNLASSIGLVLWNIGWFSSTASFGALQAWVGYGGMMWVVAVGVLVNGLTITVVFRNEAAGGRAAGA